MTNAIAITLTIESLGQIPEHHEDASPLGRMAKAYFDDGICDEPLDRQISHFGKNSTFRMIESELSGWLSDLDVRPQIHAITLDD
jgi:hypothetical protein